MAILKTTAKDTVKFILQFLTAIFGPILEEADKQPLLCGFADDPTDNKIWFARTLKNGKLPASIVATANCYFSLATFTPNDEGRHRAKKAQVAAVHAVLLDDINSKRLKELPIRPSWKIETSPGNHQVGYILKTPCKDLEKYAAVVKALGEAGWSDPGASGVARWARLPYGVNAKAKYRRRGVAPKVKLVEFKPNRRYRLDKIIEGFKLLLPNAPQKTISVNKNGSDPVLWALKAAKLWKHAGEDGKHDITCPWVNLHTDQKDHGTAYFEPSAANKGLGGFICQHGHCSGRNITDLTAYLSIPSQARGPESALDTALRIAEDEIRLVLDENGEPFGFVDGHCLPLKSREIKAQIVRKTQVAAGKPLKLNVVMEVLATLESKALVEGKRKNLHNRIAQHKGNIYYDLGDGMTVKVMPGEWKIIKAPIMFRRYGHQKVQAHPVAGGDPMGIFEFVNVGKAHQLETLVLLISYLVPDIAHPIFHPHGPQGSGKSTLCRLIKRLLDPSSLDLLLVPQNKPELVRLITRHHIPIFDNMSRLDSEMSDILCIACTGGGIAKRMNYTDDEDYIYSFRRCCGLNGINLLITKPDLLDRTMLLQLERILPEKRKEEGRIWKKFEKAKPAILGGMFDVLARALEIHPNVKLDRLPRLADFATWGYALGEALNEGKGNEFLTAYQANVRRQNEEVIKNNSLCLAVKLLMESVDYWSGTVKTAFEALRDLADPSKSDPSFPPDAKNLRRHLERIQTTLAESEDISYEFSEKPKKDGYHITFTKGGTV